MLDDQILGHLKDKDIPENIRGKLLEYATGREDHSLATQLEREKFAFEKQKFKWSTPLVVTLTGLITLAASYAFDTWKIETSSELEVAKSDAAAQNNITLEQLKAEIGESETRLKLSFQERQQKTQAALAGLAEERAFQFNLVKEQLASEVDQVERAKVLLFLAKSGILSTLKVEYLEKLANEQLNSDPGTNVIPRLSATSTAANWTELKAPENARLWESGKAVVNLSIRDKGNTRGVCTGFFVSTKLVVSTDHCAKSGTEFSAIAGYLDPLDASVFENHKLVRASIYAELGIGTFHSETDAQKTLEVAADDVPQVGLPLILIHHPLGQPAKVSRCSIISLRETEISHNCDTQGGSSGGALLSAISLQVVGLHFAGAQYSVKQSILLGNTESFNTAKIFTQSTLKLLRD